MPLLPAIISILIGNFLIGLLFKPALERLSEIREELLSVVLPLDEVHMRSFRSKPWDAEKLSEAEETARHALNKIFRKYTLAYRSFKRIGILFLLALRVLVYFTIVAAAFALWKTLVFCFLVTAVIFGAARVLAADAYPSPEQLANLDYLVSHFSNIHPESLIRLLNIGVQRITWEKQSQLILSCGLHLTGYKFFVVMTNEDESQHHFIAYGKIGANTKVDQVILPDYYRWHVPVGDLDPRWPTGLVLPVWVRLYVFIPTPVGWKEDAVSPYYVGHELWTPHPGDPTRAGETIGLTICSPLSQDREVTFRRSKNALRETREITSINVDSDKRHSRLRKLIRFYRHELENSTDITALSGSRLPPTLS